MDVRYNWLNNENADLIMKGFTPIAGLSTYYQLMMSWRSLLIDADRYHLNVFNHSIEPLFRQALSDPRSFIGLGIISGYLAMPNFEVVERKPYKFVTKDAKHDPVFLPKDYRDKTFTDRVEQYKAGTLTDVSGVTAWRYKAKGHDEPNEAYMKLLTDTCTDAGLADYQDRVLIVM